MLERDEIEQLYPMAVHEHIAAFAENVDDLFEEFGLAENPIRAHFFLAQVGHESGGLTIVEENLNYRAARIPKVWPRRFDSEADARPFAGNPEGLANRVYSNRMGNGPPESGDGWRYRGRGYIQITGREGYRQVGEVAGLELENEPDLAGLPAHALRVACAFWRWKDLNPICDLGDYKKATRRINGGLTGFPDRRAWLDKVRRLLASPEDIVEPPTTELAIAIQQALQRNGHPEIGAADGDIGKRTIAAIVRFRVEHGLPEGLVDDALLEALGIDV